MGDAIVAQPIVEKFVIAFPAFAAWIIVLLLIAIALGVYMYGKWFLRHWEAQQKSHDDRIDSLATAFSNRMDDQDLALNDIKKLIADEVQELQKMYYGLDRRLVGVEAQLRFLGGRPLARGTDEPKAD